MRKKTIMIGLKVSPETKAKLEKYCEKTKRSYSSAIEYALSLEFEKEKIE